MSSIMFVTTQDDICAAVYAGYVLEVRPGTSTDEIKRILSLTQEQILSDYSLGQAIHQEILSANVGAVYYNITHSHRINVVPVEGIKNNLSPNVMYIDAARLFVITTRPEIFERFRDMIWGIMNSR